MAFHHVRITIRGEKHDEVKNDLDEETLERQFLGPYRTGHPVTMNGKTIGWDTVDRIRIGVSDVPSSTIIEHLKAQDRTSNVIAMGGPGYSWRAAARSQDVTDQFITGPPGNDASKLQSPSTGSVDAATSALPTSSTTGPGNPSSVFVVSGRDYAASGAVGSFLRALGLQVIEWEHAVAKTGLPNPYVGDVVVAGLQMAAAAVVLLTPDDLVKLREDLVSDDDDAEEREVRGQARPNVYYEAGIADAIGRERTVIVEVGAVKSFSDAAGRHVVRYDGSPARRQALAERLRLAGLNVNTGGQEWLSAGDVEPALSTIREALDDSALTSRSNMVDKASVVEQIDAIVASYERMKMHSNYDDLSDLPDESLELTFSAQALVDQAAGGTSYADEANRVRESQPHLRIPVLVAALRAFRAEIKPD